MCGHTPDIVIYSKFRRNPFRGLGATGGRNLPILITLAVGFYNSLHGNSLHYRASRDLITLHGRYRRTGRGTDRITMAIPCFVLKCMAR